MVKGVAFENGEVLDVQAGELRSGYRVLVEGDRILDVTQDRPPSSFERIDVRGSVIMPGLCDAHVHVTACTADFAAITRMSPTYIAVHSARILSNMLARGFTTVRDAGGADYGLAMAVSEKLIEGPRLLFCGKAITQTGGHGDMRIAGESRIDDCGCCAGLGVVCDGPTEVRKACRNAIRQGANHIKLMVSGGVASPTDRISSTQFSLEEISAAVDEARAANIYCMAHAYTPRAIQRAVHSGVRSVEHGNLLDEETASLMREQDVFLVPTLSCYDALLQEGATGGLSGAMCAKISEVADAGRRALEIAVGAGVRIAFGSDLLGPMHRLQLTEFAIRGEIQKPIDVIRSATTVAAQLFGLEQELGQIAPGFLADFLVLDGDPSRDLGLLQAPDRYLRMIVKGGEIVGKCL